MKSRRQKRTALLKWSVGCIWGSAGVLVSVLLVGWLFYHGWCWGWWGRGNLLFQYWWQCSCPAASEEARYQPFKVLFSACSYSRLQSISPSGHYLVVSELRPSLRIVRVDVETGEELDTGLGSEIINAVYFLNDDLLLVRLAYGEGFLVADVGEASRTRIPFVEYDESTGKDHLPASALEALKNAQQVMMLNESLLVSLAENYQSYPERNVVVDSRGEASTQKLLQVLSDQGIAYETPPLYIYMALHLSMIFTPSMSSGSMPIGKGLIWRERVN